MKTVRIIAFFGLLMAFQCCKKEETVVAPQIAGLIGTWQLIDPASVYTITLTFALDTAHPPRDVTAFKATGKSSVNEYNAFLSAAVDGLFVVVNLNSADVAGSSIATQYEKAYFNNLRAVVRYELTDNNRLQLFHGGSTPGVLSYRRTN